MKQPPGFSDGSGRVCWLQRALYGLKQAGHAWNREFNQYFTVPHTGENRLFVHWAHE